MLWKHMMLYLKKWLLFNKKCYIFNFITGIEFFHLIKLWTLQWVIIFIILLSIDLNNQILMNLSKLIILLTLSKMFFMVMSATISCPRPSAKTLETRYLIQDFRFWFLLPWNNMQICWTFQQQHLTILYIYVIQRQYYSRVLSRWQRWSLWKGIKWQWWW